MVLKHLQTAYFLLHKWPFLNGASHQNKAARDFFFALSVFFFWQNNPVPL